MKIQYEVKIWEVINEYCIIRFCTVNFYSFVLYIWYFHRNIGYNRTNTLKYKYNFVIFIFAYPQYSWSIVEDINSVSYTHVGQLKQSDPQLRMRTVRGLLFLRNQRQKATPTYPVATTDAPFSWESDGVEFQFWSYLWGDQI